MSHFESYLDIPMIADLKGRVDVIQTDLKKQVHKAFREIGQVWSFTNDTFPDFHSDSCVMVLLL